MLQPAYRLRSSRKTFLSHNCIFDTAFKSYVWRKAKVSKTPNSQNTCNNTSQTSKPGLRVIITPHKTSLFSSKSNAWFIYFSGPRSLVYNSYILSDLVIFFIQMIRCWKLCSKCDSHGTRARKECWFRVSKLNSKLYRPWQSINNTHSSFL
jgi:hypothetical protein